MPRSCGSFASSRQVQGALPACRRALSINLSRLAAGPPRLLKRCPQGANSLVVNKLEKGLAKRALQINAQFLFHAGPTLAAPAFANAFSKR